MLVPFEGFLINSITEMFHIQIMGFVQYSYASVIQAIFCFPYWIYRIYLLFVQCWHGRGSKKGILKCMLFGRVCYLDICYSDPANFSVGNILLKTQKWIGNPIKPWLSIIHLGAAQKKTRSKELPDQKKTIFLFGAIHKLRHAMIAPLPKICFCVYFVSR